MDKNKIYEYDEEGDPLPLQYSQESAIDRRVDDEIKKSKRAKSRKKAKLKKKAEAFLDDMEKNEARNSEIATNIADKIGDAIELVLYIMIVGGILFWLFHSDYEIEKILIG